MKKAIHDLLHNAPFQAFAIRLSDGRHFVIQHPEVAFAGSHRSAPVIIENKDKQHIINPQLIVSVDLLAA